MFSKMVENAAGKGEIARYEQFLLFPRSSQKTCTADTKEQGLDWEMVKYFPKCHGKSSEHNFMYFLSEIRL